MTGPYVAIDSKTDTIKRGPGCALAYSGSLGFVASIDEQGGTVGLYQWDSGLSEFRRLKGMTPPAVGLDFASWSTCAGSPDAVCIVYGASYNGATKVERYCQVYRDGTRSAPLKLADITTGSLYNGSEKSRCLWSGAGWITSTRVAGVTGGPTAILLQHVSPDGTTIMAATRWEIPGEWLLPATSILVDGVLARLVGVSTDNVTRAVALATLNLTTFSIVSLGQVGQRGASIEDPFIGTRDGSIEMLWYDQRSGICSSFLNSGIVTVRAPNMGELAACSDTSIIVGKDDTAAFVGIGTELPQTLLNPWDGSWPLYRPSMATDGAGTWMTTAVLANSVVVCTLSQTDVAPPIPEPIPPPIPIGPDGPSLPDGTVINTRQYMAYNPQFWPRGIPALGDTHAMDMQLVGNQIAFVKFGPEFQGTSYELMEWKDGYLHHLEDASNPILDTWVGDTRWMPETMKVGYQHRFISEGHLLVKKTRGTCGELSRTDWKREVWIVAAWERFYCGPERGYKPVIRVANDNTGGVHGPDRFIETYYYVME